jgi:hypothetical protein
LLSSGISSGFAFAFAELSIGKRHSVLLGAASVTTSRRPSALAQSDV